MPSVSQDRGGANTNRPSMRMTYDGGPTGNGAIQAGQVEFKTENGRTLLRIAMIRRA